MKKFKITTNTEEFFITAKTRHDGQMEIVKEKFPHLLDDDLSEAFDIEEIKEIKKSYEKEE